MGKFSPLVIGFRSTSIFSFIRYAHDRQDFLIIISNFTPVARHQYRIGVPKGCRYRELINSDKSIYWGSNIAYEGDYHAKDISSHGHPCCLELTLPPLSTIILKPI